MAVECLFFKFETQEYYYTNHVDDVVLLGNTYLAVDGVQRNRTTSAGLQDNQATLRVDMPMNLDVFTDLRTDVIDDPDLIIYTIPDPDNPPTSNPKVFWRGLTKTVYTPPLATVTSANLIEEIVGGDMPTKLFQRQCGLALFRGRCRAAMAPVQITTTLAANSSLTGRNITVSTVNGVPRLAGANTPDNYFGNNGIIQNNTTTERVAIESQTGTSLTLTRAFRRGLTANNPVTMWAGCSHRLDNEGCYKHTPTGGTYVAGQGNRDNYGGYPTIATQDIVRSNLNLTD